MTNAQIRRAARGRGGGMLPLTFVPMYAFAYLIDFAGSYILSLFIFIWAYVWFYGINMSFYPHCARRAVSAWLETAEGEERTNYSASALLAVLQTACFYSVFLLGGLFHDVARETEWLAWGIIAVRVILGMWLQMLYYAMEVLRRDGQGREFPRGVKGLFRHFPRIVAMQFALWWQTWLLAIADVVLVFYCQGRVQLGIAYGLFALAAILFIFRSARIRLSYAALAVELFGEQDGAARIPHI